MPKVIRIILLVLTSFFCICSVSQGTLTIGAGPGGTKNYTNPLTKDTYIYYPDGSSKVINEHEVIDEMNPRETAARTRELEAARECELEPYKKCFEEIRDKSTGERTAISDGEAHAGEDLVEDARSESIDGSIDPEVTRGFDMLAEKGGTLLLESAADAVGTVLLAPVAFKLGVQIGNDLDNLFGFPEWEFEEEKSAVDEKLEKEGCSLNYIPEPFTIDDSVGGGEVKSFPKGYYASCHVSGGGVWRKFESQAVTGCEFEKAEEGVDESIGHDELMKTNDEGGTFESGCHETQIRRQYNLFTWIEPEELCEPGKELPSWLEGNEVECPPQGIPTPLPQTATVANEGHEHKDPEATRKPVVDTVAPMTPENNAEFETLPNAHKFAEENAPSPKHMVEEEPELQEIPAPNPGESGEEYKEHLEGLGFTDVVIQVLPETGIDPSIGPGEVAYTVPGSGTRVKPESKVDVETNPEDAPIPSEPKTGIGGPTEPGIKLPDFGVLCKGFPFGVPCWLVQTIEGWSTGAEAPEWGFENLEIEGTHINAKFKLSRLEFVMEKVRIAEIIFATIGVVLLFYTFAKGGGPPSGSGTSDPSGGNGLDERISSGEEDIPW